MSWFLNTPINLDDKWTLDTTHSLGVDVHLSYAAYYERLATLINLSSDGDEIFIVGWLAQFTVELIPGQTALDILYNANQRNVKIRLLLTGGVNPEENKKAVKFLNALSGKGEKIAIIDDQLVNGSDHHQKAVFIRINETPFLFIGGMDIADGPIDAEGNVDKTMDHFGWIDAQAEIIGAGALLGLNTLEERWNSVNQVRMPKSMPFIEYRFPGIDAGFTEQFIRTYAPIKNGNSIITNRNYAPDGDFTYDSLIRNAIKNAQKSIYQEDQFFETVGSNSRSNNPLKASNEIKRSNLNGTSMDELIINKANKPGFNYVGIGFNYFHKMLKNVESIFPKNLQNSKSNSWSSIFPALLTSTKANAVLENERTEEKKHRYFHSKLWIFDDELLVIGSANYWNPSFNKLANSTMSEFGVAITSTKATGASIGFPNLPYIHGLRLKMWERIRKIQDPGFEFLPCEVGDFEIEFKKFVKDLPKEVLFIPMT